MTALDRPYEVALATSSASASPRTLMTGATGPNSSSRATDMSLVTSTNTCGGSTSPRGSPPRTCRAPSDRAFSMRFTSPSNCVLLISGPTEVSSSEGSLAAGAGLSMIAVVMTFPRCAERRPLGGPACDGFEHAVQAGHGVLDVGVLVLSAPGARRWSFGSLVET